MENLITPLVVGIGKVVLCMNLDVVTLKLLSEIGPIGCGTYSLKSETSRRRGVRGTNLVNNTKDLTIGVKSRKSVKHLMVHRSKNLMQVW